MTLLQVLILAVIQGVCELLPVSSSAHVIVAEKWMGLDPSAPEMTFLLVMLHTGTMFAVIVYFWRSWRMRYFGSTGQFRQIALRVVVASVCTGVVGLILKYLIEHRLAAPSSGPAEIEQLFANTRLIAVALGAAGLLILVSARIEKLGDERARFGVGTAAAVGAVQGLCLPFRGFSRSGATISTALLCRLDKVRAESFSFALAVVLTPAVVAREASRALHAGTSASADGGLSAWLLPSLAGMALSFAVGLAALRWLSQWLEAGRWHFFGYYCLVASAVVWFFG